MLYHKLRFTIIVDGCKRAEYLRKHNILKLMGKNCMFQSRNFPMDPKLVKIHDNVTIAANVYFVTHDAIRHMFYFMDHGKYAPHFGCIEIEENVFVGLGSVIMPNVHIGKNSIIAAGSLVLNDVPAGKVVGGHPAKIIGEFDKLHSKRIQEGKKLSGLSENEIEELVWKYFDMEHSKT